jgi:hypothetical protein
VGFGNALLGLAFVALLHCASREIAHFGYFFFLFLLEFFWGGSWVYSDEALSNSRAECGLLKKIGPY